nr:zinc finger, CCHC-type [Tanacetum cinerariifolium]
ESLKIEDVLLTLNLRELKKRIKGIKEETSDELYKRGRLNHSGKAYSGGSSWVKSRGGTSKLKCFICHSEGHLQRHCLMKKSSGSVKKDKHDHDSNSSDDEGNTYFGEALVVVKNDEITEFIMDSSGLIMKSGMDFYMTSRLLMVGAQENRKAKVFQVTNDNVVVPQRRLEDKQLEKKDKHGLFGK